MGVNVTNEAGTSSNVSQPASTNKPLPIQQQQVGNQTDQSVNTPALPQPPAAATPNGTNQSDGGEITNQSQQQQQEENPLSKIPVIGETLEKINPFK
jgi:hypothetical protein